MDRNKCGLQFIDGYIVASRAEAWIETGFFWPLYWAWEVASRAEAWIETLASWLFKPSVMVASRAEAWIETSLTL